MIASFQDDDRRTLREQGRLLTPGLAGLRNGFAANLLDAIENAVEAWDAVKPQTIRRFGLLCSCVFVIVFQTYGQACALLFFPLQVLGQGGTPAFRRTDRRLRTRSRRLPPATQPRVS